MDNNCVINLQGVSVFQSGKAILNDVELDIRQGDFVYLIGKTGSGKSSLLKVLYADLPASEGKAKALNYDLRSLKKREVPFLRRKLGIVFQDFQLLEDRSVEENLHFVLRATGWKEKEKINQRILEVLEAVGLVAKLKVMPHQLSGGEQQKVAIARALLNKPEVILADEPTGNLDPETSNGIMKILLSINQSGTTVIMATHNYNIIQKFPGKVITCEDGRLVTSSNELN